MNWGTNRKFQTMEQLAEQHARVDRALPDESLMSVLGPEPMFNPARDPRDRDAVQSVNNPRIEELQDDLARLRAELSRHVSRIALLTGLALAFAAEVIGAVLVLGALGFENPERLVLGAGLAFLVFFITYQCVHLGQSGAKGLPDSSGHQRDLEDPTAPLPFPRGRHNPRDGEQGAAAKHSPWFFLLVAIYAALVLAIAVVRSSDARIGDDASSTFEWATALIMVACSIGPAWLGEHFLRRLAPVSPLTKEVRRLRQELRRHERDRRRGAAHIETRRRAGEEWARNAAQARAVYNRVYTVRRVREERATALPTLPEKVSTANQPVGKTAEGGNSDNH